MYNDWQKKITSMNPATPILMNMIAMIRSVMLFSELVEQGLSGWMVPMWSGVLCCRHMSFWMHFLVYFPRENIIVAPVKGGQVRSVHLSAIMYNLLASYYMNAQTLASNSYSIPSVT
jgi:hypothetical protein